VKRRVLVVGGGPAGMAAAIAAARAGARVAVAERMPRVGKKLLATGNGRCNVSNLSADGYADIKDFFEGLGVLLRVEEAGRAYPMSGRAVSVRDALLHALRAGGGGALGTPGAQGTQGTQGASSAAAQAPGGGGSGRDGASGPSLRIVKRASGASAASASAPAAAPELRTGCRVASVERGEGGGFLVTAEDGAGYAARRVLIATGGKAGPAFGSLGDGYAFARALGHGIETIRPSLVPLVYAEEARQSLSGLKGVRARVKAELMVSGKRAAAADGEVHFAEDALSGIVIFDLSTRMPKSIIEGRPRVEAVLDLVPGTDEGALCAMLRAQGDFWLRGVVDARLSDLIVRDAGGDAEAVARRAKRFVVPVAGTKGWKEAQTTRGGVPLSELDGRSFESRVRPGLFFAGEALNADFLCGGFNLSFCWLSGLSAGAHL